MYSNKINVFFIIIIHYKNESEKSLVLDELGLYSSFLMSSRNPVCKKLISKNCDMICANSLRREGAGFGVDTNVITLITKDSEVELPQLTKEEAAHRIFDFILG